MSDAEDAPQMHALLKGVGRMRYFNDRDLTMDLMHEQVFTALSKDAFEVFVETVGKMLADAIRVDLAQEKALEHCSSYPEVTEGMAAGFAKYWKANKRALVAAATDKTQWAPRLEDVSWRVDVTSQTSTRADVNKPTAILELKLSDQEQISFEVDAATTTAVADKLTAALASLDPSSS